MNTLKKHLKLLVLFFCSYLPLLAQPGYKSLSDCRANLENGILTIENSRISRSFLWNEGNLISKEIINKRQKYTWSLDAKAPDCFFPGTAKSQNGTFEVREIPATSTKPAHLLAEVSTTFGSLQVKRTFRIYPDCPAIACDYYLKGKAEGTWVSSLANSANLSNIEGKAAESEGKVSIPVMERLGIAGNYIKTNALRFYDVTDRNNNLVSETPQLAYRGESYLQGNLLLLSNFTDKGIFILKESPNPNVQLAYPGFDFSVKYDEVKVAGIGVDAKDVSEMGWTKCYSVVTGVAGKEAELPMALREYQQKLRIHLPGRDEMIMMNTWGDRNQDKRMGEKFALEELKAAKRLGITHFQLDDGWQSGRSANSAFSGGTFTKIWDNPEYWKPDLKKFPTGLAPVMQLGKELGIEVCLWFAPSNDDDFAHWKDDANALIYLYEKYGIRTFKIDGVKITSKQAEDNLRSMFELVLAATKNKAVFNLDVTAGKRYGYHYFNEYGNMFLENRYTDWGNYYPHWTLRNLWMLSRYVPAQNLQVEFLNVFRNKKAYPQDDLLAPSKIPFEYTFATTMAAQPLAWFEATGLPEESFSIGPVMKKYRDLQGNLHKGMIFPIGEEPSGKSWTGFQSIQKNEGYFIVYRELNPKSKEFVKTYLQPGTRVSLTAILGSGKTFIATVDKDGKIPFEFARQNSYALYKYQVRPN